MPVVIPVRMHFNAQDLWFDPGKTGACKGDHVIVTTERGTEFGLATMDPFEAPEEELHGDLKPVLRIATESDIKQADALARKGDEAIPLFRELISKHELDMKPVGVEFLFGGEKVVFYFSAEERVDFRELVRDLATRFRARVDMRQIGVRDEVRLIGGYAPCGQELCCVRLGGKFEPVSIRMAKEQDLPLNSTKISGLCGRLMCCLRYEFEAYKDFKSRAPKHNAIIDTPLGKAKVIEFNTPRELVTMRLENGKTFTVALKDMKCSQGCCKRAKEQGIPLRPDTVTRESLEALGTAEIMAQLAELDRVNNPDAYELDSSLLSPSRQRRARAASAADEEPKGGRGPMQGTPRRSTSTRTRKAEVAGDAESQETGGRSGRSSRSQKDDRPAQRKGMQPRRQAGAKAGQATEAESRGTQGGSRRRGAQSTRAPQAEGQARDVRSETGAQAGTTSGQPARRARRHHTTASDPVADARVSQSSPQASADEQRQGKPQRRPRQGRDERETRSDQQAAEAASSQRNRQRRRHHSESGEERPSTPTDNRRESRQENGGSPERQPRRHGEASPRREQADRGRGKADAQDQAAERRNHGGRTTSAEDAPKGSGATRTHRRRRPGDHGGGQQAESGSPQE